MRRFAFPGILMLYSFAEPKQANAPVLRGSTVKRQPWADSNTPIPANGRERIAHLMVADYS
jgi:hypothetical protein